MKLYMQVILYQFAYASILRKMAIRDKLYVLLEKVINKFKAKTKVFCLLLLDQLFQNPINNKNSIS